MTTACELLFYIGALIILIGGLFSGKRKGRGTRIATDVILILSLIWTVLLVYVLSDWIGVF